MSRKKTFAEELSDDKKTYVFVAGKYHFEGKVYKKGDSIELTEEQAKGLANQIVNPQAVFTPEVSNEDAQAMLDRIKQLEELVAELRQENEQLKEAIDAEPED